MWIVIKYVPAGDITLNIDILTSDACIKGYVAELIEKDPTLRPIAEHTRPHIHGKSYPLLAGRHEDYYIQWMEPRNARDFIE